jgi:voltage-gated potassium channel
MDGARRRWLKDGGVNITLRSAVLVIIGIASTLAVVAALLQLLVDPAFENFGDALWWAVTTVTTVGYGDVVPAGTAGRLVGAALMLVGLGLIPLVTSVVVSILVSQRTREAREAALRDLAVILERLDRVEQRLPGFERDR